MRFVLWGLLLFVLLFLVSLPLTGGVSLFLLPVLPLLALYVFGFFIALVIAAKLIQRLVGLRDVLSLAAIVFGLFIAALVTSAVWQWIDSFGCPATIESLVTSGPDQ